MSIIHFIEHMDVSLTLLIRSFMNNTDEISCSMVCRSMQKRITELYHDLVIGYTQNQLLIDTGRFWKCFDLQFQLNNREVWNMLAKEQFFLQSKKMLNNNG